MSVRIDDLKPQMWPGVRKLVRRGAEEGVPLSVRETHRELSTQIAYWLRGRAPVWVVKAVFARCGLWAITDAEAAKINTKTLDSKHVEDLAVDVVPLKDGAPWWDAPPEVWEKVWKIAEDECGLDACAAGKWQAWKENGRPWDLSHHEFRTEVVE